jgi:hypothetical protein
MLSPLGGANGKIIGKIAFKSTRREWLHHAECYCGGFQAAGIYDLVGVLEGRPTRASRDRVAIDVSLDSMQDWIREQWDRFSSNEDVADTDLLRLQWFSLGFGIVNDAAPLAISRDGLLKPDEVVEWIGRRDSFTIARLSDVLMLDLEGKGVWMHTYDGLMRLPEDALGVSFGPRRYDDEFPLPAFEPLAPTDKPWSPDEFDGRSWWAGRYFDPEATMVRCAAKAWSNTLETVIDRLAVAGIRDGVDTRATLETFEGTSYPASGLRLLRTHA